MSATARGREHAAIALCIASGLRSINFPAMPDGEQAGYRLNILDSATGARWNNLHEIPNSFPDQSPCSDRGFSLLAGQRPPRRPQTSSLAVKRMKANTPIPIWKRTAPVIFMEQLCSAGILEAAQFLSSGSTPNGWVRRVLYSFTSGADGGEPYKGVTLDREGNLYGTAVSGGSGSCEGGCGVVYKLTNSEEPGPRQ